MIFEYRYFFLFNRVVRSLRRRRATFHRGTEHSASKNDFAKREFWFVAHCCCFQLEVTYSSHNLLYIYLYQSYFVFYTRLFSIVQSCREKRCSYRKRQVRNFGIMDGHLAKSVKSYPFFIFIRSILVHILYLLV